MDFDRLRRELEDIDAPAKQGRVVVVEGDDEEFMGDDGNGVSSEEEVVISPRKKVAGGAGAGKAGGGSASALDSALVRSDYRTLTTKDPSKMTREELELFVNLSKMENPAVAFSSIVKACNDLYTTVCEEFDLPASPAMYICSSCSEEDYAEFPTVRGFTP
jgi:hypothetical protein